MERPAELQTRCLSPGLARDLVVAIERLGVDTGRIHVAAAPPSSIADVGRADSRSVKRPGWRALRGLVLGLVVGLVVAFIVVAATSAQPDVTLIAFAIGGLVVGGLAGLYSQLPTNTEVADVDTGQESIVRIDVAGLDSATVAAVQGAITDASSTTADRGGQS